MARIIRWILLLRRFLASLREEGPRAALRKVRIFVGMRLRGAAPSLFGGPSASAEPHQYMLGLWSDMARGGGFHARPGPEMAPRIALIGDLNLAQCRKYRVEQLAEFWEAQGVGCEFAHYQDVPRVLRLMQQATHLCEYRLQVMPITTMFRYEARRLGLPVLYDIDDPLFSISAYETYGNMEEVAPGLKAHFLAEAPKYAEMMNGADLVTLSTPGLMEHAGQFTRRPVYLRRNFADKDTLKRGAEAMAGRPAPDGLFRVVFASGSMGHEADFMEILAPLRDFILAAPERRLTILGHFKIEDLPEALAERTEHKRFVPYDRYLGALAACDVAVMPLRDDLFNRCKSGVRVIDAASVGLPSVVGTVGDLQALVEDGTTGIVARGPEDWRAALERLAGDPGRCRAMGRAARAGLERRWSTQSGAHIISPQVLSWVQRPR